MSALDHALVRILFADGAGKQAVGGGFLASSRHVLTCAHVVAAALNVAREGQEAPPQTVSLDFPLLSGHPLRQAKVIRWEAVKDQTTPEEVEDIAVLELSGDLPAGAQPARLFRHTDYHGHAVELLGFPAGMTAGSPLSGVLHGLLASGKVHIDTEQGRLNVAPGFSGTPVWDTREKAVVGMVDSIYQGIQDTPAYMIPVATLLKAWPALEQHNRPQLGGKLGDLAERLSGAPAAIRDKIVDFIPYLEEKTQRFTGRQFVFDAFDAFRHHHPRGYFVMRGDPGIGKSALSAELVKNRGYLHHFNIRAEGINRTSTFLTSICAQLIAAFGLNYSELPPETVQDANFFSRLLREAADKLPSDHKLVLVVDALDEVDNLENSGANILYLPIMLPEKVYAFLTMRRDHSIPLHIECEHDYFDLTQDAPDNVNDIRSYVAYSADTPVIRDYLHTQNLDKPDYIRLLTDKSQGNFMYLRYVIPEIEQGAYRDTALTAIPAGLENYYQDHWRRMKTRDDEAWFQYKLPVIVALTIVKEPISIDLIADFSQVKQKSRIRAVLRDWDQFLYRQQVPYQGGLQVRYRMYHGSFHDFLAAMEEIAGERVDLKAAHGVIADNLWNDLFNET